MVTDFDKLSEVKEFLWHLDICCLKYPKQVLKENLSYQELITKVYEGMFPKKGLNKLDLFFREAIKQTIVTYCQLLQNEDIPIKPKKEEGLVGKIMATDLDWVQINKEAPVLKEIEKHVHKYGNKDLAKELGQILGNKIYKQKSQNLIKQLMNKEFPNHTSDFFNAKNFSKTLDLLYFRISKWMKNERKR